MTKRLLAAMPIEVCVGIGILLFPVAARAHIPAYSPGSAHEPDTFSLQTRLATGTPNDSYANTGVAISGNTAIVASATGYYVYIRTGTTWSQQTVLIPSDGLAGCGFPQPVALSGDTAVAGCSTTAINGNANQGAVYVFVRNGTAWTEQQRLTASDGSAGDRFGNSVAISGDTIIAGAPTDAVGANTEQGSAYAFVRNGAVWTEQMHLLADDGAARNNFGHRVSIDVNTAVVVRGYRFNASDPNPAVYVFVRNGTVWQQQQRLSVCEPSSQGLCNFGYGIGVKGDTLVVGNQYLNVGSNEAQGGVYVFARSSGTWTQQQRLSADDGAANDYFGDDVAIEGQTMVIGAYADLGVPGKAYVYGSSGDSWSFQQKLQHGTNRNAFAQHLSFDGTSVICAAPADAGSPGAFIGAAYVYSQPIALPRTVFDFDGDGKSDLSVFRPSVGEWYYQQSSNGVTRGFGFGTSTDKVATADFTGDGKTDIAFWRPSTGDWYVLRSEDSTYFAFPFGSAGDIPVPADYDGDGMADPAVYRPSAQTWFILRSTGGVASVPFGLSDDIPEPADYDGDGKADIGIYRPSVGQWWNLRSSNGSVFAATFGSSTDKPVPGDYTGDGKADVAFFRPSDGNWYILRSEDQSFYAFPFGANGDKPVPADYDGDGKFDAAVFRPSEANWYILQSTGGLYIQQYGAATDIPLPGAFVP